MKHILLLFIVVAAISCTKEKVSNSIVGNWVITERIQDAGGLIKKESFSSQEVVLQFHANGELSVSGSSAGSAYTPLWNFNQYQVSSDNNITFINSTTLESITVPYTLNSQLLLDFSIRCFFSEKFERTR